MKNTGEVKRGKGRPADPNALKYRSIGLRPDEWEYLDRWKSENDAETYYTGAVQGMIDFLRTFAPGGPAIDKPRDERGWFTPAGGTSRAAQTRERKRNRRAAEEKKEEVEGCLHNSIHDTR